MIQLLEIYLFRGLEFMHSLGVVHLDIKPFNILFANKVQGEPMNKVQGEPVTRYRVNK